MTFPEPAKLFGRFAIDAGTEAAARANFQMLVTDLVIVQFPDATTVEGAGGRDWGIDTVTGELSGGDVRLWQSKFVADWQDKTRRSQVYKSYKSAKTKADENGYVLKTWTLVVPCVLAPDELKWFQMWAKRRLSEDEVGVDLWDGIKLRHLLQTVDAEHVTRSYFPHLLPAPTAASPQKKEAVAHLDDPATYDGALFVRQLREAGRTETDVASAQFFATDALFRDYADKGDEHAVAAMRELELEIREIWENRFNEQVQSASEGGRIPDLIDEVIEKAGQCADPEGVAFNKAHKKGTAHRIVEQRWAGWVKHWRQIATDHSQPSMASSPNVTRKSLHQLTSPGGSVDAGVPLAAIETGETS